MSKATTATAGRPPPAEVANAEGERWTGQNREAIATCNEYVERCGLPLAVVRQF